MQQLNRAKLFKEMWKYLNNHFRLSYPYPDVAIFIMNEEEARSLFETITFSRGNLHEKDKEISNKPLRDAFLVLKKGAPEEDINALGLEHDFEIAVAEATIPHDNFPNGSEREYMIKTDGFMNYYYFLVFHEFIHILEWLCGNHNLYYYDQQDLELFKSFMGWDYAIMKLQNIKVRY